MSENEWVQIPDAVTSLSIGTVLRHVFGGDPFELTEECQVAETDRINYQMRDDLGDTPEHLKPLLRAARMTHSKAVVIEDHCQSVFWIQDGELRGYSIFGAYDLKHLASGCSWPATHSEDCDRQRLERAIREARCYPTADARRIGREEFGMRFEGEDRLTLASDAQLDALAAVYGTERMTTETDEELRERLNGMWHTFSQPKPEATKVLTSPITWADIEVKVSGGIICGIAEIPYANHRECPGCDAATYVVTADQCAQCGYSASGKKRSKACKCGSTTNVNLRLGVCAACHLEKRKAEVRKDLDRKVPESLAPKGWPEQFSGSSWEE
jgi:ribosomal protein L37E